jgi:putative ABC transport system permease protein
MSRINKHNAIFKSAMADLFHEWPLTLCVILSIAAILLPLAVLYGLKFGVISVLEERLRNDPRSREIKPLASSFFDADWVRKWRRDPRVTFAVGLPRSISATVQVPAGEDLIDSDIVPTGPGDPVLDASGIVISGETDCAISELLAAQASLKKGDKVEIRIKRRDESGITEASTTLRVAGILPTQFCDFQAIYAPLPVAEAVEDFFDGFAVEKFSWPGSMAVARPVFDGAIVSFAAATRQEDAPATQSADEQTASPSSQPPALASVRLNLMERLGMTGFTSIADDSPELRATLGVPAGWPGTFYYLSNANSSVDEANVGALRSKLEPLDLVVAPWTMPAACTLREGAGPATPVEVIGWSPQAAQIELAPATGLQGSYPWSALGAGKAVERGVLAWSGISGTVDVEINVKQTQAAAGRLWIDSEKAGLIKRSKLRAIERQGNDLLYARQGYAAFRIAVADLSYVAPIKKELESQGIRVLAETGRIEEIKFLDKQLGKIFSIFAAVSGVGAITCLLAIAYSSAERKKRSLAFLQIMGATRAQAARFPLYQCIFLTICGALLAWAGNHLFATAVNAGFRARLERGESLSNLPIEAVGLAFAILLLIALASFLIMIPRFVGMSLSEAAREP